MATRGAAPRARTGGNPFLKTVGAISTLAGWVAAAMIVAAVAITCQMIFVRFVLNHSTIWQTELVVYLMVSATLIGLSYVQNLRGHVNVDLLPMMLRRGPRKALAIVTLSASIAIIGIMFFYGFEFWHFAWARGWHSDTVWGVRLWIPYLSVPVGLGLLLLQLVADLFALVSGIDGPPGANAEAA